jgi:hypothetical protein
MAARDASGVQHRWVLYPKPAFENNRKLALGCIYLGYRAGH